MWKDVANSFQKASEQYNNQLNSIRNEFLLTLELFSKKHVELFSELKLDKVDFRLENKAFLNIKADKCHFSEYYLEYDIYELKRRSVLGKPINSKITTILLEKQNMIKEDELKIVKEFTLMLLDINKECLYASKIMRMENKIKTLYLKKHAIKFLIFYITAFLLKSDVPLVFNNRILDIFEDLILNNIANLFESEQIDYESLFNILICCYEIYCGHLIDESCSFSTKFMKFLKNISLWYNPQIWIEFIDYLCSLTSSNTDHIYFTHIIEFSPAKKKRLRKILYIYQLVIFIAFYFLKLPFNALMDIINNVNEKNRDLSQNSIYDISKLLESHIHINYNSNTISNRDIFNDIKKSKSLQFVLKHTMTYLTPFEDNLIDLTLLDKHFRDSLSYCVYKCYLRSDLVNTHLRLLLWDKITSLKVNLLTNLIPNSAVFSLDERSMHILEMDVKRTNFARYNSEKLHKLLWEISGNHPGTSYYQGMNCIGGFLLNYTDDYNLSKKVFSFLVKKKLEVYFGNNFARVKKLLYVAERIIKIKLPRINDYLKQLHIGNEFYLSPLILTIFSSSLQFIDNYTLVAKIYDLFIADGWVGFFKVFILLFSKLEKKIVNLDYDKLLAFLNKDLYETIFCINISNLKSLANEIKISKQLIHTLEREYDKTRKVVEEYWASYYNRKRQAKQDQELIK